MGISDRLLGKKNVNGHSHIEGVHPSAALPGGEVRIVGKSLRPHELRRPQVRFGDVEGAVVISSDDFLVARVPPGASSGPVVVSTNGTASNPHQIKVAAQIAENLHPVTNPALDADGNIYVTFSGSRGQKVPVAIFKIDTNYNVKPFLAEMTNATAIAFDRVGQMYVSSRFDGTVYLVAPNGTMYTYAEGMGGPGGDLFVTGPTTSSFDAVHKIDSHGSVSTFYRGLGRPQGLAFDIDGNLYVAASLSGKRGIVRLTPDAKASLEVAGPGLVGLACAPGKSAVLATTGAVHHLSWGVQGTALVPELPA